MKIIKNITADEIKKSILKLAIQGKLVKQNLNDEPASELIKKIYKEKQNLINEGKIKKDKDESYIFKGDDNYYYEKIGNNKPKKLENLPFNIPNNWVWIRFNQLVHYYMGKTPERIIKEYWNSDFPWITISDIKNDNFLKKTKESISILAKDTLFKNKVSPIGTLIMSFKLTIGNVSILDINATHNEAIISIFPFFDTSNVIRNFLFKFLPLISNNGNAKDAIKGKTLNSNSINNLLIPLPPLKEQERIVYNLENINKLITKITTN
ncbi:restriction endonuclease subunit S [Ureaplasma parvum]|uniref:restriction endonuclease subunit S n=1 Tax=Ureaplasma parvum TaxID=134821 RepID=UPI00307CF34C